MVNKIYIWYLQVIQIFFSFSVFDIEVVLLSQNWGGEDHSTLFLTLQTRTSISRIALQVSLDEAQWCTLDIQLVFAVMQKHLKSL